MSGRTFNLANWNVRTTNDSDNSVRLERVTAIICRELERAVIEICALTEVRRPKSGNIVEKSHTIFWSGGQDKNACVGFAVSNKLENITPQPINDRLITCRIDLQNGNFLILVSAYTPTMQRTVEEKELFYENLGECMRRAKDDSIFILGDFNPRVCDDWQSWPIVMGKHGVGKMNTNGPMLLEFITGTIFQLNNHLKTTWTHARSRHWRQLDHILVNSKARVFVKITKASLTADCFTDHRLLICKCKISAVKKKGNSKPPKEFDTTMTKERKET